jgi:hypothetical protein
MRRASTDVKRFGEIDADPEDFMDVAAAHTDCQ